jgi:hypothetical protein
VFIRHSFTWARLTAASLNRSAGLPATRLRSVIRWVRSDLRYSARAAIGKKSMNVCCVLVDGLVDSAFLVRGEAKKRSAKFVRDLRDSSVEFVTTTLTAFPTPPGAGLIWRVLTLGCRGSRI